jgi:hypothetical protein
LPEVNKFQIKYVKILGVVEVGKSERLGRVWGLYLAVSRGDDEKVKTLLDVSNLNDENKLRIIELMGGEKKHIMRVLKEAYGIDVQMESPNIDEDSYGDGVKIKRKHKKKKR